ncbi:hypothetical protein ECP03022934_3434 [Escherichia coli P0302293.4]|nr:hypothetical protein ECP03022934_3434 [Escherichia coli P0302293.4]
MPFNGQCEDIFHQFRPGSADIIITHNLKNAGTRNTRYPPDPDWL